MRVHERIRTRAALSRSFGFGNVGQHWPVTVVFGAVVLLFLVPVWRVEEVEAAQSGFHRQADHAGGATAFAPLQESRRDREVL